MPCNANGQLTMKDENIEYSYSAYAIASATPELTTGSELDGGFSYTPATGEQGFLEINEENTHYFICTYSTPDDVFQQTKSIYYKWYYKKTSATAISFSSRINSIESNVTVTNIGVITGNIGPAKLLFTNSSGTIKAIVSNEMGYAAARQSHYTVIRDGSPRAAITENGISAKIRIVKFSN